MYVIKKGQYYVSKPGSANSYTTKLQRARLFTTRDDATKDKCGNEHVVSFASELPHK